MPVPYYPPVPEWSAPDQWDQWLRQLAQNINLILKGKSNCTTTVTLTPGATSTVLTDERIGVYSNVHLEAKTSTAAQARTSGQGLYVVPESGRAVIYHQPPGAGATFMVSIFG